MESVRGDRDKKPSRRSPTSQDIVSRAAKNLVRKEGNPEKVGDRKALGRQYFKRGKQTDV